MEKIISELKNNLNQEMMNVLYEYNLLKDIIDNNNKTILTLTEDNKELKVRINQMVEEKKSKSSSALWESTQVQLREKDIQIENLKKELEFYKRNSKSNNLMEKYPYNHYNTTTTTTTNISTSKNEKKEEKLEKKELSIKNNVEDIKEKLELEVEKEKELEVEQELELEVEKELEVEVEQESVKKDKKSKKDKSKVKGEKKKKKKKETIKVEDDDDELEKELSRL